MRENIEQESSPRAPAGDGGAELTKLQKLAKRRKLRRASRGGGRVRVVARSLGWFSIGLGLSELLAGGRVARLVGVRSRPGTRWLVRAFGARELAAGMGLLSRPTRPGWLWSRVAGDLMDLAALGVALASPRSNRVRAGVAAAAVLGVTAVDAWAGQRAMVAGPRPVRRAITIGRSPWAVYRFWRQLGNLPRFMTRPALTEIEIVRDDPGQLIGWRSLESAAVHHEGTVRFSPAPDGDGTEVLLELHYGAQHGLKAALRSMVEPVAEVVIGTQMEADLSRFKQLMETGDIARAQGGGER